MSVYSGLLPNYRLVGQNVNQARGQWAWNIVPFYPLAGTYPAVADSYSPEYLPSQTRYGHCGCWGGALRYNSCRLDNGYRPQCLANGQGCRCTDNTGTDWGCWNTPGSSCT